MYSVLHGYGGARQIAFPQIIPMWPLNTSWWIPALCSSYDNPPTSMSSSPRTCLEIFLLTRLQCWQALWACFHPPAWVHVRQHTASLASINQFTVLLPILQAKVNPTLSHLSVPSLYSYPFLSLL